MLPDSGCVMKTMGMVNAPVRKGDDHAAAAASVPGPGRAGRAGTPLPHHPRRRDPHPLPDGPAGRAGPHPTPDRHAGPAQPPHHPPAWQAELVRVAELDPHEVGVDSALWTCRLLSDYLAGQTGHRAGIETVRLALHRAGYVCKRPRWVLSRKAQAQPGWAKNA